VRRRSRGRPSTRHMRSVIGLPVLPECSAIHVSAGDPCRPRVRRRIEIETYRLSRSCSIRIPASTLYGTNRVRARDPPILHDRYRFTRIDEDASNTMENAYY